MEQRYAYLSNTGRELFNDDFMDALDALEDDMKDDMEDENFAKKNMPEIIKKVS